MINKYKNMLRGKSVFKIMNERMILIIMIAVQCVLFIAIAQNKAGFHIDELYSYGLANNHYAPFVKWKNSDWYSTSKILEYLVAEHGEIFDYGSVIYNQMQDVHPPVFYLILHTICSFFPEVFSKWHGISINLFFFILTQITLFFLGKEIMNDEKRSLIPVFWYGFSTGALSTILFVRMYMMLTAFCTILVYINYKIYKKPQTIRNYLLLLITVTLGCLIHYYFYVYAFGVSAFFCIAKLIVKEYRGMIKYICTMLLSIMSAIILYPSTIKHIFHGSRGVQAIENLKTSSLSQNIEGYIKIIHSQIGIIGFLVILCFFIYYFYKNSEKENMFLKTASIYSYLLLGISLFYIVVIAKVAPYIADRYVFCTYPLCILGMSSIMLLLFEVIKNAKLRAIIFITLLSVIILCTYHQGVNYLYADFNEKVEVLKENEKLSAVILTEKNWKIDGTLTTLLETKDFYCTDENNKEIIIQELLSEKREKILLYVSDDYQDNGSVAREFALLSGFENIEYVMEHAYFRIYALY